MTTSGDPTSPVWIIGEAWGENEAKDAAHRPFIGPSGNLLSEMLADSGFVRDDCFLCNVVNAQPPGNKIESLFFNKTQAKERGLSPILGRYPNDVVRSGLEHLARRLSEHHPKLIIALGNTPLWAITGKMGIMKWRGSQLQNENYTLVPTIHPAAVLRQWSLRPIVVHDLRRAKGILEGRSSQPKWNFHVQPAYTQVCDFLRRVLAHRREGGEIAVDIETRGGQIACVGIALSTSEAMCIPFMCLRDREGYWSLNEEFSIITLLREVLCLANLDEAAGPVCFQNGAYDLQYFCRQWGFLPDCTDDTMLMQHTVFPGLPKRLDFLASMYCEHYIYWKDDGKEFDPRVAPETQLWKYNCEDCVRTLEIFRVLRSTIQSMGRGEQYKFQMKIFKIAVKMMLRGVRIDREAKAALTPLLDNYEQTRKEWLSRVLKRDFNCRSPKQMVGLFYTEMGLKPILKRTDNGYRPTCDDEALNKIKRREPLLRPLVETIQELRSIGVFRTNYAEMSLGPDGRMRSSINLAGTETYRFSMSEDAFGFGGNLQTIPKGTEDD